MMRESATYTTSKPSSWGLWTPGLLADLRPIADIAQMFTRFLAGLFVMHGLFPRHHPAFLGLSRERLTLREVVGTAWLNLSFTRQRIPQVIVFGAIVGALVFGVLFGIAWGLHLAIGAAGATGLFEPAAKSIARDWIKYIFLNGDIQQIPFCIDVGAVGNGTDCLDAGNASLWPMIPHSTALQSALCAGMAFYSSGVLACGGCLCLYYVTTMTAETAHTGVPMGKSANQLWTPIRFVLAIGLLVPAGGCLNVAQLGMTVWFQWSVGLADQTFNVVLRSFANYDFTMRIGPNEGAETIIGSMQSIYTCEHAWNMTLEKVVKDMGYAYTCIPDGVGSPAGGDDDAQKLLKEYCIYDIEAFEWAGTSLVTSSHVYPFGSRHYLNNRTNADPKIARQLAPECGSVTVLPAPDATKAPSQQAYEVASTVDNTHRSQLTAALDDIKNRVWGDTSAKTFTEIVNVYNTQLRTQTSTLAAGWTNTMSGVLNAYGPYGFAMICPMCTLFARAQAAVMDASTGSPFVFMVPALVGACDYYRGSNGASEACRVANVQSMAITNQLRGDVPVATVDPSPLQMGLGNPRTGTLEVSPKGSIDALINLVNDVTAGGAAGLVANLGSDPNDHTKKILPASLPSIVPSDLIDSVAKKAYQFLQNSHTNINAIMKGMLALIDSLGGTFHLWDSSKTGLEWRFGVTNNPLGEMAYQGYLYLQFGIALLGYAFVVSTILTLVPFFSLAGMVGPLYIIAGLFVLGGLMLALYTQLLIYFKCFFLILAWLLSVVGAIISAPIFALAHLSPKGETLPGDMARQGYFYLFGIFLRPTLIVLGVIVAFLLLFIGLNFLNFTYSLAVIGTGGWGQLNDIDKGIGSRPALFTISRLFYSLLYIVICYVVVNGVSKAPGYFVSGVLTYMNINVPNVENLGSKGDVTGFAKSAPGQLGQLMRSK